MKSKTNKLLISSAISTALFGSALLSVTANAQESEDLVLEETLVTAQKRSESLQEVPIVIHVGKYLLNYRWIFDAGDNFHITTALSTGFDINVA